MSRWTLLLLSSALGLAPAPVEARRGSPPPRACHTRDGASACRSACAAGSQQSCAVLGVLHLRGSGGARRDLGRARRLLKAACRAKVALGCGALGSLYMVRKLPNMARPLFVKGCEMGDALACESLGGIALNGGPSRRRGAAPDPKQVDARARAAAPYYRRACRLGSPAPCASVAAYIVDGIVRGTPREALALFVKACAGKIAVACRLGEKLLRRAPRSLPRARRSRLAGELLERGCKLQDAPCCARLRALRPE